MASSFEFTYETTIYLLIFNFLVYSFYCVTLLKYLSKNPILLKKKETTVTPIDFLRKEAENAR